MNTSATYDIYALGNALVDLEFSVSEHDLQRLGTEKGRMELVDASARSRMLEALSHLQPKLAAGGSAANTLVALCQLGGKAFFSCQIANDEHGRFYAEDLLSRGVQSNLHVHAQHNGHTGTCLVLITPDAQRSMATHLGASAQLAAHAVDTDALRRSKLFYMEGYLSGSDPCLQASLRGREIAQENGIPIALTLSDVNMIRYCGDGIRAMIGDGVDTLFCNEDEAMALTGETQVHKAAKALLEVARQACITRGPLGSMVASHNHGVHEIPSPSVQAVDTNGAGDMFAGAFIYAMQKGYRAEHAAILANHAAAKIVTQHGTRLSQDQMNQVASDWLARVS